MQLRGGQSQAERISDCARSPGTRASAKPCWRDTRSDIADVTRQEDQAYVAQLTQVGYAPRTIDHIHDMLHAVFARRSNG